MSASDNPGEKVDQRLLDDRPEEVDDAYPIGMDEYAVLQNSDFRNAEIDAVETHGIESCFGVAVRTDSQVGLLHAASPGIKLQQVNDLLRSLEGEPKQVLLGTNRYGFRNPIEVNGMDTAEGRLVEKEMEERLGIEPEVELKDHPREELNNSNMKLSIGVYPDGIYVSRNSISPTDLPKVPGYNRVGYL